jgi:hypothetical protein
MKHPGFKNAEIYGRVWMRKICSIIKKFPGRK